MTVSGRSGTAPPRHRCWFDTESRERLAAAAPDRRLACRPDMVRPVFDERALPLMHLPDVVEATRLVNGTDLALAPSARLPAGSARGRRRWNVFLPLSGATDTGGRGAGTGATAEMDFSTVCVSCYFLDKAPLSMQAPLRAASEVAIFRRPAPITFKGRES